MRDDDIQPEEKPVRAMLDALRKTESAEWDIGEGDDRVCAKLERAVYGATSDIAQAICEKVGVE